MTTDKAIDGWKNWLAYSISREIDSPLAGLLIQMRDSEDVKTYPGIYLEESSEPQRIQAGGVIDGNSYRVMIETKLVTTPGEDDQLATSKAAHDALRNCLAGHIESGLAEDFLDAQTGWACHQLLTFSPVTSEPDKYRVTTWKVEIVACLD